MKDCTTNQKLSFLIVDVQFMNALERMRKEESRQKLSK